MNLEGRTAIITGATGALGSVIAAEFLEAGASIGIPYSSAKSRGALSHLISGTKNVLARQADLMSEADVGRFIQEFRERFGRIDILVNAAGGYVGGALVEESSLSEVESIMKLNFTTTFLMCRAVIPVMRGQKYGRIVNIAASPAVTPKPRMGPYAVSKSAVITLTETIASEVKGTGLTANAVVPSIIFTEANKKSMPDADVSKWVTPLEIARLILYLSSEEAGSVSGNAIKIYGGV